MFLCSSLHKVLVPAMRLGWMSGGRWQQRIEMLTYSPARPNEELGQLAVAEFMAGGQMERHLSRLRERLAEQREQMSQALALRLPAGTRVSMFQRRPNLWSSCRRCCRPTRCSTPSCWRACESRRPLFSQTHGTTSISRASAPASSTPEIASGVACLGWIVARLSAF